MKPIRKIFLDGEGLTNLELFVGVITQFTPPKGDLCCCNVAILAEDHHTASALVAMKYPDWELQSLTNLTAFVWFKSITLDSNCPQVQGFREFVIQDVKTIPVNEEEDTFHQR